MSEPTPCCRARTGTTVPYCDNCDLLAGLEGLHVIAVDRGEEGLTVTVESAPAPAGCPGCGVVALSHGRRVHQLVDTPSFGGPTRLAWRKRTWCCLEPTCAIGTFTEQDEAIAAPRALLSTRACWWAIGQIRREHASVAGLARHLGTTWATVWRSTKPLLEAMTADHAPFEKVATLGVDEHIWHQVSVKQRGPKEMTGMVDLSRDEKGQVRAHLLDLVPGRSGEIYKKWLQQRGGTFRTTVKVATLDPFHGYKNAIDDQLDDARVVLDAFHVVKLSSAAVDEVRRRVQQDTTGHRGRAGDPLYRIRTILRAGQENLTDRQRARLEAAFAADERHIAVEVAYHCAQRLRAVYHQPTAQQGRKLAEQIIPDFPSCPIPEIARLGRTLRRWKDPFLAYFTTGRRPAQDFNNLGSPSPAIAHSGKKTKLVDVEDD